MKNLFLNTTEEERNKILEMHTLGKSIVKEQSEMEETTDEMEEEVHERGHFSELKSAIADAESFLGLPPKEFSHIEELYTYLPKLIKRLDMKEGEIRDMSHSLTSLFRASLMKAK
jgi:hypothetical protein